MRIAATMAVIGALLVSGCTSSDKGSDASSTTAAGDETAIVAAAQAAAIPS